MVSIRFGTKEQIQMEMGSAARSAETSQFGNVEFSLRLNGGQRYRPGDRIGGQIMITAREHYELVFAEAFLFFRTEGMGDRNEGKADTATLAPSGREIPRTLDATFEFVAPSVPITYYGTMIKIHWMVGIYIQSKGGKVHGLLEVPVIIHPNPDAIEMPEMIPGNGGKLVRPVQI